MLYLDVKYNSVYSVVRYSVYLLKLKLYLILSIDV